MHTVPRRRLFVLLMSAVALGAAGIGGYSCGGAADLAAPPPRDAGKSSGTVLKPSPDAISDELSAEDTMPAPARRWALPQVPTNQRTPVVDDRIYNDEAPVPPQCYTKTEGRHNPCYTCHQMYDRQNADRLNELDDGGLQGDYMFSDVGQLNHWRNLFVDRQEWLGQISDEQIRAYVDFDNYTGLRERLRSVSWKGFIPDLRDYADAAAAFDEKGLAKDGSFWVAYDYKPFLGTFWPTNGSTDDVVLRLPAAFREHKGRFDKDVYFVNLTLVELAIKDLATAPIWPIDEVALQVDVDGNGKLSTARQVAKSDHYVGDAREIPVAFMQFPQGAEIMHSVRYVGVDDGENIIIPRRMKELRYMRKVNVLDRQTMRSRYANERKEKRLGQLPSFINRGDEGLDNGVGWFVQGFLEDYEGELRPQSFEESLFCMGCHTSVGTTIDSTFSFARKRPGSDGWGYINLRGMKDAPSVSEPGGEIRNYLVHAGGGSEFRENPEMQARWFNADGSVKEADVLAADVYTLITPSARRAHDLNKAYTHIVRHQSFIHGRDATWVPARNVLERVDDDTQPLDSAHRHYQWDLRLDWAMAGSPSRKN